MSDDEASETCKPQGSKGKYKRKSLRRIINAYFFVVCVLFMLLAAMCYNNLSLYNKYASMELQYTGVFNNVKAIKDDRHALDMKRKELVEENEHLEEKYERISRENQEILKSIEEIKRKNAELMKKNKELMDDNIALQNTLKMAASVGIKPQSFTKFTGFSSRGEVERGTYVGKFTGTAYTPSRKECGNNNGITNSGKPIIPGISLAIDGKHWPFGTIFYIKGLGYAVAMDSGSAIKGKHRFDFAVFDKKFAKMLGVRKWDVYLVKLGNGKVDKIDFLT
ncbi:MAG: 3D domain-containing protein [Clostridia bacterium]|nr:3D domain-containing protein [Clostridia bacterium]